MENSAWKRPLSKNTHHTEITATAGGDEIDNGDSVTTKVRRMRERGREGGAKAIGFAPRRDYVSTIFGIICSAVREPIYSWGDEKTIAGSRKS